MRGGRCCVGTTTPYRDRESPRQGKGRGLSQRSRSRRDEREHNYIPFQDPSFERGRSQVRSEVLRERRPEVERAPKATRHRGRRPPRVRHALTSGPGPQDFRVQGMEVQGGRGFFSNLPSPPSGHRSREEVSIHLLPTSFLFRTPSPTLNSITRYIKGKRY